MVPALAACAWMGVQLRAATGALEPTIAAQDPAWQSGGEPLTIRAAEHTQ